MVTKSRQNECGFTLLEILVVVVILGVLAAIVIPAFGNYAKESIVNSFATSVKEFATVAQYHLAREGQYFEDASSGELPAGMDAYIYAEQWTSGTPVGGVWDYELDSFGVKSAFGVHFNGTGHTRDDTFMQEVDVVFDDGDLSTGCFRKLDADRYYYVVADN